MGDNKGRPDRRFTKELLDTISKRDNATVLGEYQKLTSKTKIEYICACGNKYSKSFSVLPTYKMFCRSCINKTMMEKTKQTNIERYGCEDPNQLESMKTKIKDVFMQKYGVDSPMKVDDVKEKMKQTFLEKYGVENPFQNDEIKKKITESFKEKYGVEHALQYKEFQEKFKETLYERYGVTVPYHSNELKERGRQSCLEKFGVEHSLQCVAVKEKSKQTCLQKYGVEFAMQTKLVQERVQKNAKKFKNFTFPSGTIRKVQGYEPFALKKLLVDNYKEEEIITNRIDIPRIEYTVNNNPKYYFPDIYIPHENKIIEVKSTWTYSSKTDNIVLKSEATKNAGYNYEIWVFNYKGEITHIDKN